MTTTPPGHEYELAFFPDWGHPWPLWGGETLARLELEPQLVSRLKVWSRVWQEVLDPVEDGTQWPSDEIGWAWIAEGHRLLDEVRLVAALEGLRVNGIFDEYSPQSLRDRAGAPPS